MKKFLIFCIFFSFSALALESSCINPTITIVLDQADSELFHPSRHGLTGASYTPQKKQDHGYEIRVRNFINDSAFYKLGLREDDTILKTNIGTFETLNDVAKLMLGGIPFPHNCLYIRNVKNDLLTIKIEMKD
jgi:hypothetical protein